MQQTDNPLIPEKTRKEIEDQAAFDTDNPLIPSYPNNGRKQTSAAVNSKSTGTAQAGRRLISSPDASQLAIINQFANREHTADELLVGQIRLANNCIDRDNERFSEEVLQHFAETIVRKTLLLDHDSNVNRSAIGKFFAVDLEKMPVQQAMVETSETLQLAPGMNQVWFLSPWFYIPKKGISEKDLARLESGVFDFVSIGFSAERLVPITDGQGATLFHEYQGKGYAREGSIVYLGAQYGASIKGAASETLLPSASTATAEANPLIPGFGGVINAPPSTTGGNPLIPS
jgi:hypothetical protein